jgi:hypothetical protein
MSTMYPCIPCTSVHYSSSIWSARCAGRFNLVRAMRWPRMCVWHTSLQKNLEESDMFPSLSRVRFSPFVGLIVFVFPMNTQLRNIGLVTSIRHAYLRVPFAWASVILHPYMTIVMARILHAPSRTVMFVGECPRILIRHVLVISSGILCI